MPVRLNNQAGDQKALVASGVSTTGVLALMKWLPKSKVSPAHVEMASLGTTPDIQAFSVLLEPGCAILHPLVEVGGGWNDLVGVTSGSSA